MKSGVNQVLGHQDLLNFISCEKRDENCYLGQSQEFGGGRIYGGQVLAQALEAANDTVDDVRVLHSAHAYFLRMGDSSQPVEYQVERCRDGRNFSSRRVVAVQNGKQIFHLSASFQLPNACPEYSRESSVPVDLLAKKVAATPLVPSQFQAEYFDAYILDPDERTSPGSFQMWVKAKSPLPKAQHIHLSALAYISDMGVIMSMIHPHEPELSGMSGDVLTPLGYSVASLDHAIWFHRPLNVNDWIFYDCRAESTGGGRGFSVGRIYSQDGVLLANTTQEGLINKS